MLAAEDHLQRDDPGRLELLGLVDDAHAAAAEDAEQVVAGDAGELVRLGGRGAARPGTVVSAAIGSGMQQFYRAVRATTGS